MMLFLVERFCPGLREEDLDPMVVELQAQAATMTAAGRPVTHVSSTFLAEDETCLCFFESESAEFVAEVNELAGARFDRIVAATALRLGVRS